MGSKSQEGFQIDKCDNRPTEKTFWNKTEAETEARVEDDVPTEERRDHTHNDTVGLLERGKARLGQGKEPSRRETQNTRQAKTKDKRLLGRSTARLDQRKTFCEEAKCWGFQKSWRKKEVWLSNTRVGHSCARQRQGESEIILANNKNNKTFSQCDLLRLKVIYSYARWLKKTAKTKTKQADGDNECIVSRLPCTALLLLKFLSHMISIIHNQKEKSTIN